MGFGADALRESVLIRDPYPNRKCSGWLASFLPHQSSAEAGCATARKKRSAASANRARPNMKHLLCYKHCSLSQIALQSAEVPERFVKWQSEAPTIDEHQIALGKATNGLAVVHRLLGAHRIRHVANFGGERLGAG